MEQQTPTIIENALTETELDFFLFADLCLTDEQLAEIKGGDGISSGCSTWRCGYNHNETAITDDSVVEEDFFLFADLSLTDEQLAEIKGGDGTISSCGAWRCGYNHNETTVEDDAEEITLEDLIVSEEQEDEVKGGCVGCGIKLNHNETTVEDA